MADDARGEGPKVMPKVAALCRFCRIRLVYQRLSVSLYLVFPSVRHLLHADSRGVQVCSAL